MKKAIIYLVLLLPATAGIALGQGRRPGGFSTGGATTNERPSNNTPRATKMAEPYSILLTQSIFARDRRSSTAERTVEPIADPPNPETFLAFRGVTVEADQKVVIFLEDTRDNTLFHLHIGDTVTNTGGKLTGVSLDSTSQYILAYTHRDGLTTSPIPLGNSLANVEVTPPAVADATSAFGGGFGGGFGAGGGFGGRQQFGGGGFGGNQYNSGNLNDLQAAMGRGRQRGQGGPGGGQYGQIDTSGFGTGGGGRQRFGQQGGGQFDPTQQGQGGGRRGGGRRGGGGGGGAGFGG
ncbi:MAG TPA: hypothetical protein VH370_11500 [Humisphaera sp.]|jgi:hypothetical protein|nr:hypothetical protein [Humisphaera sp.]